MWTDKAFILNIFIVGLVAYSSENYSNSVRVINSKNISRKFFEDDKFFADAIKTINAEDQPAPANANIINFNKAHSFVFVSEVDTNKRLAALQTLQWKISKENLCTDILLIQQRAQFLREARNVLPYRSILILDCTKSNFTFQSISVNHVNKMYYDPFTQLFYPVSIINGRDVVGSFKIGSNWITVDSFKKSEQIIVALTQAINIQDKDRFQMPPGVFSYFSKDYEKIFRYYASQLPFTQTYLLQMQPLGGKIGIQSVQTTDRFLQPIFLDYVMCGNRIFYRCNGKPFKGESYEPYTYDGEEFTNVAQIYLNQIFGGGIKTLRQRTITKQYAEYENKKISKTGMFEQNYFGAWVSTYFEETINGDNELPHELGHSYGLRDNSGSLDFDHKHKSYFYNNDLKLVWPFNSEMVSEKGSMNSGRVSPNDKYFSRLNSYSDAYATKKMQNEVPFKREIIENLGKTKSLYFVMHDKDILGYVINTYLPPSELLNSQPSKRFLAISLYQDNNVVKWTKYIHYSPYFVLPGELLNLKNKIVIRNLEDSIERTYYLVNGHLKMPEPIKGIDSGLYKKANVKEYKYSSQILNITNNLKNDLEKETFSLIIIKLGMYSFTDKINLPILSRLFDTDIYIENKQTDSVKIVMGNDQVIIKPNSSGYFKYGNGWTNGWKYKTFEGFLEQQSNY